jgi:uncharacterized SAM-binding protein YcdF (DUF218 family)
MRSTTPGEMSNETVANRPRQRRANSRRRLALLLIILLAAVFAFRNAGYWLIREDPLQKSDVIVVLSGGMPARAQESAQVFLQGYAPELWVSRPDSLAPELEPFGVNYVGEDSYNRQILLHYGVPDSAIHIFPENVINTEEEIDVVLQQMTNEHKQRVIIVTSPQHTRRVRALWKAMGGAPQQLIVHAAFQDPFDAAHWWRTTRDSNSVVHELGGLLNVWTGLRIRPHPHR